MLLLLLFLVAPSATPPRAAAALQEPAAVPAAQEPAPPAARPPLLLRGATLHTMVPGEAPRVSDLWIEDGHIRAFAPPAASGTDPLVLDLSGKHVIPGLIDALVNFDPEHDALYLAAGVTLVRDLGGDHFVQGQLRAPELRERVPGPALLTAGAPLDGDPPITASAVVLRSADAAESYLPILFEEGVDFLSVLPGLPEASWRKVLALAHEHGLRVFGPRPATLTLAQAAAAGQDGFHGLDALLAPGVGWNAVSDAEVDRAAAALVVAGKALVPLLHASALRLEDQEKDASTRALLGLLAPGYESWWRAELAQRREFLAPERRAAGVGVIEKQARALRALYDAGAHLVPGSGAPQPWLLPGTALHLELAQWVRAGIPSAKVLELATRGAAEALGLAGQRGTIQPGAWADLVVLDADPETDLARLLDPAWVVVRGRALSRADIAQRLDALGRHQAAVREERARPVEVEAPPQGEPGRVLLEGTVESRAFGERLSTERYRIVRLDAESMLYTTRVLFAAEPGQPPRELTSEQFVRDGRVVQLHATLKAGDSLLEHDGLWTAGTWRMQTRLDGRTVNVPAPFRDQPVCVDTGGVSSLLILAQVPPAERVSVVQLHPGFDAENVNWRLERDEQGRFRVRTQVGFKLFELDPSGALTAAYAKVGSTWVETRSLGSSAFGGGGVPARAARPAPPAEAAAATSPGD